MGEDTAQTQHGQERSVDYPRRRRRLNRLRIFSGSSPSLRRWTRPQGSGGASCERLAHDCSLSEGEELAVVQPKDPMLPFCLPSSNKVVVGGALHEHELLAAARAVESSERASHKLATQ